MTTKTPQRHVVTWARQTGKATAMTTPLSTAQDHARAVMQVPALRACALCMHSAVYPGATEVACLCPTVIAIHGIGATAAQARSGPGACGPDARHLDMHSWQRHREAVAA